MRIVTIALALGVLSGPVQAIDINWNFDSGSSAFPAYDPTGSQLTQMFQEAASYWSDIIETPWTLDIDFYYFDFGGITLADHQNSATSGGKPTGARIRVDTDRLWYFDPTPTDHGEFDMAQTLYRDLTASQQTDWYNGAPIDLLEVGFTGNATGSAPADARNGFDLFSVVLHEMGHAVGMTANVAAGETADLDYDFDPDLVGGAVMAAECYASDNRYHLDANGSLMYPQFGTGARRLPSATDIFSIEGASDWGDTYIDLRRQDFIASGAADWYGSANWAGNQVPGSFDDAWVRHGGTAQLSTSAYVASLVVDDAAVTLVGAANLDVVGDLRIGDGGGLGILLVTDGSGGSSANCSIGGPSTGLGGLMTVSGTGSAWTNSGELDVGRGGEGRLVVENGGAISSVNCNIGYESGSTGLLWQRGGSVTISQTTVLGKQAGSDGTYQLDSGNVYLDSLVVGERGNGSFWQQGGTNTISSNVFVGHQSGSDGTYILSGTGQLSADNELIGNDATGTFIQTGGTNTVTNDLYLGYFSGSDGTYDLSGTGQLSAHDEYVGYEGTGTFTQTGGTNTVSGTLSVAGTYGLSGGNLFTNTTSAGGTFTQSAGTHTVSGTLSVSGTYEFSSGDLFTDANSIVNGGTFTQSGGTHTVSNNIFVGDNGTGTLNITDGGTVSNNSYGAIGRFSGSTGLVTVDGPGSTWTNTGWLRVGSYGDGTLNITGGGAVSIGGGAVGYPTCFIGYDVTGSTGAVTVDGPGSTLTNSGWLYVGNSGTGTLNITGGGAVSNGGSHIISSDGASVVTVDGPGSTWTNGDNIYVGGSGTGTLNITGGGAVSNSACYLGRWTGTTGVVMVDGPGSTWTNSGALWVGGGSNYQSSGGSGTLNVTNGGVVSSTLGFIGYETGSIGEVTVDGPGSTWTNSGGLDVGTWGDGTLTITAGGVVSNGHSEVGYMPGSTGMVTVDGPGSTWTNSGQLRLGVLSSGTLNVTGGGVVNHDNSTIGCAPGGVGVVTVEGPGSTWTNTGDLYVGGSSYEDGSNGGSGTLNVTNGGAVDSGIGHIGGNYGSTGVVTVDGPGSTWTSDGDLYVGEGADSSGILNITGGGTVSNSSGYIGYYSFSTGAVTVDGPGSTWTSDGDLWVGGSEYWSEGTSGTLNVTSGGVVDVRHATWVSGYNASGTIHFDNGTLTTGGLLCGSDDLTGTGTINTKGLVSDVDLVFDAAHGPSQTFAIDDNPGQNITVNLDVDGSGSMGAGYGGAGTMTVSDGIALNSSSGHIGYKTGSIGAVTVDGPGSTWTNSGDLWVGESGSGTLNVTGGGAVSNSGDLYVGEAGSGTLNVTGGGAVDNSNGHIGCTFSSTGEVTVDGPGSMWTNSDTLYVGGSDWHSGGRPGRSFGTLNVTGGGAVSSGVGFIGYSLLSTGVMTVDGPGSTWTNSGDLNVGYGYSGTLNVTGGGLVSAGILTIDTYGSGYGFINMATGGMLALNGNADASLIDFLGLVGGTDAIRYGVIDILDWDSAGLDYQLSYLTTGDLAGYTMLTMNSGWGDFDLDSDVDADDIDLLCDNIGDPTYDLDGDLDADEDDLIYLVENLVEWDSGVDTGIGTKRGDFNLDGIVNATDLAIMKAGFGQSGLGYADGNANSDDVVNATDLAILKASFGFEAPTGAVPGPATLSLLALGGLAMLRRRKQGE